MKKISNKILMSILILIFIIILRNKVNAVTFQNVVIKDNVYIVPYGKEIKMAKTEGETVFTNDTDKVVVTNTSLKIIGIGRFKIIVKTSENDEKVIDFFAWNAYLKNGSYFTYADANKNRQLNAVTAKVYLALSKPNKITFKVEDHIMTTGNYKGNLNGKYLTSYFDGEKSKTSNYEYSFKDNVSQEENDSKERVAEELNKIEEKLTKKISENEEKSIKEILEIIELETKENEEEIVLEKIKFENEKVLMKKGDTATLKVLSESNEELKEELTFTSSDENILTVDKYGKVTAKDLGEVEVTAKTQKGAEAKCIIKISELVKYNSKVNKKITVSGVKYISVKAPATSIASTVGKQGPDECYEYASKYANKIVKYDYKEYGIKYTSTKRIGMTTLEETLKIMALELEEGRPIVIRVRGKYNKSKTKEYWSRHYVTVIGIKERADMDNLKESDFIFLDPVSASIKKLGTKKRKLLLTEEDCYHYKDAKKYPGYQIYVYTNPAKYLTGTVYKY